MSNSNTRVSIPASQAQNGIPQETLNSILSALLSTGGINNIESSLTHDLQRSGWLDKLAEYVRELFRSGECSTVKEAMAKVKDKIERDGAFKANGTTNGVNGANGTNGNSHSDDDVNLAMPEKAISNGSKVVRKELDKVCEITSDGDK
jgi:hypothetical protein